MDNEAGLFELLNAIGWEHHDQIHLAGLECHHAERCLRERSEDNAVEIGLPAPIVRIALQDYFLPPHAFDQAKGAGTNRMLGEIIVSPLLEGCRAYKGGIA